MTPTFGQQLLLAAFENGFLAVVVLFAGLLLNRALERYKSDLDWLKTLAVARVEAYRQLWTLTKGIGGAGKKGPLSSEERRAASTALSDWYWEQGNGLFLPRETASLMMKGWGLLADLSVSDDQIREHYSGLRTHLKTDAKVYSREDAAQSLR